MLLGEKNTNTNIKIKLYYVILILSLGSLVTNMAFIITMPETDIIPETYMPDPGITNPNLKIAKPVPENNSIVYFDDYLDLDKQKNESEWALAQWQAAEVIDPANFNYTLPSKSDPLLGQALFNVETNTTGLAIFNSFDSTTRSHYVYQLTCQKGTYTSVGGRNLFLSTTLKKPFPLTSVVQASLKYKIIELEANGSAPDNVGQIFIGFIFQCNDTGVEGQIDTIFIQAMIANTHHCNFYAAGNPDVKTGIYAKPIPGGLKPVDDPKARLHETNIDLIGFLRKALPINYTWMEGSETKSKTYNNQDPKDWMLTSLYIGLETQGNTTSILQVTDVMILYSNNSIILYSDVIWIFFIIGLAGVSIISLFLWNALKRTDNERIEKQASN
ncbi:MAG: hypothetical protein ACTSXU_04235 [Promethearchaeota archaeon]